MNKTFYISYNQAAEFKWFVTSSKGAYVDYEHYGVENVKFIIISADKEVMNKIDEYVKELERPKSLWENLFNIWNKYTPAIVIAVLVITILICTIVIWT
jgi:hypothetical protein